MRIVLVFVCLAGLVVCSPITPSHLTPEHDHTMMQIASMRSTPLIAEPKPITLSHGEQPINKQSIEAQVITAPRTVFPVDAVIVWMPSQSGGVYGDDGLRYELRSVFEFASFVRKVHIAVPDDSSLPAWIDKNQPKLNIVTHHEVFERSGTDLPTHNRLAVEANIHRIPGLAEHFILFHEGMLLTSITNQDDFFTSDGRPIVYSLRTVPSEPTPALSHQLTHTSQISMNLLESILMKEKSQDLGSLALSGDKIWLPHCQALTLTQMTNAESLFADRIAKTSHHKDEGVEDISLSQLASWLAVANNQGVVDGWSQFEFSSVDLNASSVSTIDDKINDMRLMRPKFVLLIADQNPTSDQTANRSLEDNQIELIHSKLERLLPVPCDAERVIIG